MMDRDKFNGLVDRVAEANFMREVLEMKINEEFDVINSAASSYKRVESAYVRLLRLQQQYEYRFGRQYHPKKLVRGEDG